MDALFLIKLFDLEYINLSLLATGLVGLMIATFITGIVRNNFHWSHHVVRLIISLILFGISFKFKN